MSTRWKREPTTTLILMHAHNLWSRWNDCLLTAARDFGLPICEATYPNCSGDGSWDHDIYTLTAALDRVGGLDVVQSLAMEYHAQILDY
jgi:hypothetical protein